MYHIAEATADQPEIIALIAALDSYQSALYPAESNHLLDLAALPPASLILRKIVHSDGGAVGCGAVVLNSDGSGEMKRVFIDPAHRGQQLGERLIAALERAAHDRFCHTLRLETGIRQLSAIKLYERCGYLTCPAFAPYQDDPLSLFMEKSLVADLRLAMQ